MDDLVRRLGLHTTWRDSHGELNDAPNEAKAAIEHLQSEVERLTAKLSSARQNAKQRGRDMLRDEADAVLKHFRPEWEQLRTVAARTGRYSAAQLASRARDLLKRGLVEQQWNEGVMRMCRWRLSPDAALSSSSRGETR